MNFDKTEISAKVMEFLEINLNQEEDKKSFARLLKGNKLLYKEADAFIDTLLKALTIMDGKEDVPFVPKKDKTEELNEDESLTQALKQAMKEKVKEVDGIENKDPTQPPTPIIPTTPISVKNICHFYTINKCKFGKDCRKEHPKMCPKFKKHGLKKFNKLGCEESCQNYHPKACFEAMKTKTCKRSGCKFYHIAGTKKCDGDIKGT